MSEFLYHSSCPNCGSKDNLAVYSDHKFCFGCKYVEKTSSIDFKYKKPTDTRKSFIYLPEDVNTAYPLIAEEWIKKYDLTINTLYKNHVLWSEYRKLLIFPIFDDQMNLWGWQGRYFGTDPKHPKWTSKGTYKDLIKIFNESKVSEFGIIFTEDIISAIKVSQVASTSCLYGSFIDLSKMIKIDKIYRPTKLVLWLDKDKEKESKKFALELNNIDINTRCIVTTKDPKEYSIEEIKTFISIDKT